MLIGWAVAKYVISSHFVGTSMSMNEWFVFNHPFKRLLWANSWKCGHSMNDHPREFRTIPEHASSTSSASYILFSSTDLAYWLASWFLYRAYSRIRQNPTHISSLSPLWLLFGLNSGASNDAKRRNKWADFYMTFTPQWRTQLVSCICIEDGRFVLGMKEGS